MCYAKPMARMTLSLPFALAAALVAPIAAAADAPPPLPSSAAPTPAAVESAPPAAAEAPAPASANAPAPPPPAYVAEPAPPPSWPQRRGFTLELGVGASYTTVSNTPAADGGFGLAPLSLSLGGFVSSRVALAARMAGTSFFVDAPPSLQIAGAGASLRSHSDLVQILNGFYGPTIQVFVNDHVFVGGGAGLGLFGVSPLFERTGPLPKLEAGFAMTGRAGFGFFARGHHWVGVVLEAFPGFYSDRTTFGMSTILQWQYY